MDVGADISIVSDGSRRHYSQPIGLQNELLALTHLVAN